MSASRYVHLDFEEIVSATDKALLVRFEDDHEEWVPLSQVADHEDYSKGDGPGVISVTEWFLSKMEGKP